MILSEPFKTYLVDLETLRCSSTTLHTPDETLERILPLMPTAGVSRLSQITNLDFLGIPAYSATRPSVDLHPFNVSVYHGKGLTDTMAKLTALMEAFERYSAERHDRATITATFEDMSKKGNTLHPKDLILHEEETFQERNNLEWVAGTELFSGEPVWLPAAAVFFPYLPKSGGHLFKGFTNTTGIASGMSFAEAAANALSEVIERDSDSVAEAHNRARTVDLKTIDTSFLCSLIQKFEDAGINLVVKDVTSDVGIPSFCATTDDPQTENPLLLCRGLGADVNRETAFLRAVTEVAQSRCSIICGGRENLKEDEYKRSLRYQDLKKQMAYWYENTPPFQDFREINSWNLISPIEKLTLMMDQLKQSGFKRIIVVNLTCPELNIPTVRILVPGLEQASTEPGRVGKRACLKTD